MPPAVAEVANMTAQLVPTKQAAPERLAAVAKVDVLAAKMRP
jgi:hypothetical protein